MYQPSDPDGEARCPMCKDTGAVVVPHIRCVSVRLGRLVTYPGARSMRTAAVACTNHVPDAGGMPVTCPPGASLAAHGLMTWPRYTELIGGLDGVAMLLDLEAERAAEARGTDTRPPEERLAEMFPAVAVLFRGAA
ncbi:MAG: hypothetical protein U0804_28495 [Gemmataceae bacterium]